MLTRRYPYYDPIDTLPPSGQRWWAKQQAAGAAGGGPQVAAGTAG